MKVLILAALLFMPFLSMADEPQKIVEKVFQLAGSDDINTNTQKQGEVAAVVDFSTLAKSALGKNLKSSSAADVAWFENTLKEIITKTVYPKAPEFLKGVQIAYDKVDIKKNIAIVKSTVQNKSDFTEVEYKLEKNSKSDWRVIDVSISGLSWVESIREQVGDVIKKKKWAGLKEAMNKRLSDIKAGK